MSHNALLELVMSLSLCLSLSVLSVHQRQQLDSVVYSSRFALALFFSPDVDFSFSWAARYVSNNHCIRYIAADSRKRNAGLSVTLTILNVINQLIDYMRIINED